MAALVLPALLALVLRPLGAMAGPLVDADVGPMTQVVTSRTCTTHEVPRNAYTTGGAVRLRLSLLCACLWSVCRPVSGRLFVPIMIGMYCSASLQEKAKAEAVRHALAVGSRTRL